MAVAILRIVVMKRVIWLEPWANADAALVYDTSWPEFTQNAEPALMSNSHSEYFMKKMSNFEHGYST